MEGGENMRIMPKRNLVVVGILVAATLGTCVKLAARSETKPAGASPNAAEAPQRHENEVREAKAKADKLAADEAAAKQAKDKAEDDARRATYAKMSVPQLVNAARECARNEHCHSGELDAIEAAASIPADRRKIGDVATAELLVRGAQMGSDGTELSNDAIVMCGEMVRSHPGALNTAMARTSPGEAAKDPARSRGKVIQVTGSIVEIHASADGAFYEGSMTYDVSRIARFVTPLPTEGIVEGSRASFRGVFVQEYAYPNVAGGQTRSLLLVGGFLH